MIFIDLAAGFFRRNARSEGTAEGGEFRRARAFRRSETETINQCSPQNEF